MALPPIATGSPSETAHCTAWRKTKLSPTSPGQLLKNLWIVPQQYSGGAWDYPKATAVDKAYRAYAQLTLRHLPTLPGTVRCCILDSRSSLIERRQNWLLPSNHNTSNLKAWILCFTHWTKLSGTEQIGKATNCWIGSVSAVATKALPDSQLPRTCQNLQSCQ